MVSTFGRSLEMMDVRNQCYEFMTGNPNEITKEEQREWFWDVYLPSTNIYCYVLYADGISIGYGIIREEESCSLLTGGLVKTYRGKGIGREIFQFLIDIVKQKNLQTPIELDVREDNVTAQNLYIKLGFGFISQENNVFRMRLLE